MAQKPGTNTVLWCELKVQHAP